MIITIRKRDNNYKGINSFANRFLHKLYDFHYFLSRFGDEEKNESKVYDHLGIIDTLGWKSSRTKFTYSFSEELGSIDGFKLPFNYCIEIRDYSGYESEIYIGKRKF